MRRRPPRKLSAEDKRLWAAATASMTPMEKSAPAETNDASEAADPEPPRKPRRAVQIAPVETKPAPSVPQAPQIDRKQLAKLKKGKVAPEARLDLHGKTQAEARALLYDFVFNAQARGLRMVLVITGKGKLRGSEGPIPEHRQLLRYAVPEWLRLGAMQQIILDVTSAHGRHGGEGAYYVYLRRNRKLAPGRG